MLPLYLVFWCLICSRRLSLTPLTNGRGLQDLAWLLTVIERDKAWGLYPHLEHRSSVSHKVRFDQVGQRFILAEWSDGSWGRWERQREGWVGGEGGRVMGWNKMGSQGWVDSSWLRECRWDKGANVWWKDELKRRGSNGQEGGEWWRPEGMTERECRRSPQFITEIKVKASTDLRERARASLEKGRGRRTERETEVERWQ